MHLSKSDANEVENAEMRKIEAEILRINAETRQLSVPFWQKPGVLIPGLSAIASGLLLFSGWLGGYFDRKRAELGEQKAELQQDVEELKGNIESLVDREIQQKILLVATEADFRDRENLLVTERQSKDRALRRESLS